MYVFFSPLLPRKTLLTKYQLGAMTGRQILRWAPAEMSGVLLEVTARATRPASTMVVVMVPVACKCS